MKLYVPLLVMSLGVVLISACTNECTINDILSDHKLMNSLAVKVAENTRIMCTDVKQSGSFATCPGGFTPTGCACGMACGSWDIQSQTTCHCQCRIMDWTTARCCKVAAKW
ncbi:resistin-like [Spea bombifrons]|uniref:resistin-like n=1 Tax=Spea bombifrons TaxID=233779 RepID=UPI00234A516C|nr:resistin-like [Spea bombifrons]